MRLVHVWASFMRSRAAWTLKRGFLLSKTMSSHESCLLSFSRRSGYDITEAATGLDAINRAHASHPDLIIMDLGLPGITGDEATARLKADAATRDIPVIVNTGFHRGSLLVERAIAAGAAMILHKPTPLKVFQEVARQYLSPEYMTTASSPSANQ